MSVRGEILRGIKVALLRTKSEMKTTEEQGGRHHGLDIIEHRNSDRFFGSLHPSLYLERAEPHLPASGMSTKTHLLRKALYPMLSDTHFWSPIETVNWGNFAPTYPFRFNGPGHLYCRWCTHYIRVVCRTKTVVLCSDSGQALALAGGYQPTL